MPSASPRPVSQRSESSHPGSSRSEPRSRTSRASLAVTARALRYPLRSRPRRFWTLTLTLATLLGLFVTTTVSRAQQMENELGNRTPAVVALRDLPAGHLLAASDVELRDRPLAWLPEGRVDDPTVVVGQTLLAAIATNEVVLADRVGSPTDVGIDRLGDGERGVAVDIAAGLEVGPGTPVELVSGRGLGETGDSTLQVAGRVMAIAEAPSATEAGRATIAVEAEFVAVIAEAARTNSLSVVLAPDR